MLWYRPAALLLAAVLSLTVPPVPKMESTSPTAAEGGVSSADSAQVQSETTELTLDSQEPDSGQSPAVQDSTSETGSSSQEPHPTAEEDTTTEFSKEEPSQPESNSEPEPAPGKEPSESSSSPPPTDETVSPSEQESTPETNSSAPPATEDREALTVQLPTDLSFIIDPYELAEHGQVYSDPYLVKNNGTEPVMVTIRELCCTSKEDSGIHLLASQEETVSVHLEETEAKYLLLMLRQPNRPEQELLILTEEPLDPVSFPLEPDETISFSLCGAVSLAPSIPWRTGDVQIQAIFSVEPIPTTALLLEETKESNGNEVKPDQSETVGVEPEARVNLEPTSSLGEEDHNESDQ